MLEFIARIDFSNPILILMSLIPFIILIGSYFINKYSSNYYCDSNLLRWVTVKNKNPKWNGILKGKIVAALTWGLFCIALSGPRISIDERSLEKTKKYDNASVIVLDASRSMLAEDVYPNRFGKAKIVINEIVSTSSNTLFSLVIYAKNAHIVIPLTYDSSVINDVLNSIRPGMLPIEGSNYEAGLAKAQKQLNLSDAKNKSILLFSDGDFDKVTEKIATLDNPVNVFAFGTTEGQPIPKKGGGWVKHDNQDVVTRLNEGKLQAIAKSYQGQYRKISSGIKVNGYDIDKYPGELSLKGKSNTIIIWKQIYQWFLIPGFVLFILSTMLKSHYPSRLKHQSKSKYLLLALSIITITSFNPTESQARDYSIDDANNAYKSKNFIKSEQLYSLFQDFNGRLGKANSVYRQKNYSKAIHLYTQALLKAHDDKSRSVILFNMANAYYITGDYLQSIRLYRDTLKYAPTLRKARINLQYSKELFSRVQREIALRNGNKKETRTGIKPGNGPSAATVEQGVDIGNSKVTLAENDDNKDYIYSLPKDDASVKKLIERGIQHSEISSTQIEVTQKSADWKFDHTTIDMLELLVKQEQFDNYNLWKRLFELEEGFPAPVETPHILPGVNPW